MFQIKICLLRLRHHCKIEDGSPSLDRLLTKECTGCSMSLGEVMHRPPHTSTNLPSLLTEKNTPLPRGLPVCPSSPCTPYTPLRRGCWLRNLAIVGFDNDVIVIRIESLPLGHGITISARGRTSAQDILRIAGQRHAARRNGVVALKGAQDAAVSSLYRKPLGNIC